MKRLCYFVLTLTAIAGLATATLAQRTPARIPPRRPMPTAAPPSSTNSNNTWAHQIWKNLYRAHTDGQSASADPQSHKGKALSSIEQAVNELAAGVNTPKVAPA